MKITNITLALIFFCSLIYGQNNSTTIGFKFNPGIATIYKPLVKDIKYARFSTNGGIEIRQGIFKEMLFVESGVHLLDRGYSITGNYTDISGNNLGKITSKEIEYFISIPITFIYKQNGIYFGAGPNINYYLARKFVINGQVISRDKSYPYLTNNIIYGFQILAGYEFELNEKLLVDFDSYINPTFKYKYMNFGLGIGLKYSLKKNTEWKTSC